MVKLLVDYFVPLLPKKCVNGLCHGNWSKFHCTRLALSLQLIFEKVKGGRSVFVSRDKDSCKHI